MENKLFKKLNNQLEINSIKNRPLAEEEVTATEKKVVFEGLIDKTVDDLNK